MDQILGDKFVLLLLVDIDGIGDAFDISGQRVLDEEEQPVPPMPEPVFAEDGVFNGKLRDALVKTLQKLFSIKDGEKLGFNILIGNELGKFQEITIDRPRGLLFQNKGKIAATVVAGVLGEVEMERTDVTAIGAVELAVGFFVAELGGFFFADIATRPMVPTRRIELPTY